MSPLEGVRVVDFGHFVAGPYVSRLLADLGADVVKIEPLTGDHTRRIGANDFAASNAGKRSVAIDLKSDRGLELARSACEWADVVHHNFRLGVAQRFGLDAESLRTNKPQLIVLEILAYGGQDQRPGFDGVFQSMSGLAASFGGEGNPPDTMSFAPVDYGTASLGAASILAALIRKRRTGEGASLGLSLLEGSLFLTSEVVRRRGEYEGAAKLNSQRTGLQATESLYEAQDGWIAIVAPTDECAKQMAQVLKIEPYVAASTELWGESASEVIAGAVANWTVTDLTAALRTVGVWAEPCDREARQRVFSDPLMTAIGAVFDSEDRVHGRLARIGLGFQLETMSPVASSVALPGESTTEFLAELGYADEEIQSLVEDRVVATTSEVAIDVSSRTAR